MTFKDDIQQRIILDFKDSADRANELLDSAISKTDYLKSGYFGVMVPPVSVKQCHFERSFNNTKNVSIVF